MFGSELTILVALLAGVISFLSPCVLPVVPAYLGQLTAVAVTVDGEAATGARTGRWTSLRHALAFVGGFGLIFTLLGVTATFAAGPLVDYLPALRQVGGVVLIVLGLNLAGIIRIRALDRAWRPLDAGAAGALATSSGGMALATPGGTTTADRIGGRLVGTRGGWVASFGLGSIFAIGWTPCIGIILGGILTMAATAATAGQGLVLLVAYSLGLGVPFIAIALAYDRAPGLLRPLLRHGRLVSFVGGLLVVGIGVAMIMDWLILLPRYFTFLSAI